VRKRGGQQAVWAGGNHLSVPVACGSWGGSVLASDLNPTVEKCAMN
jgi:hypothetical protein